MRVKIHLASSPGVSLKQNAYLLARYLLVGLLPLGGIIAGLLVLCPIYCPYLSKHEECSASRLRVNEIAVSQ